jgi:hypothetical protein
MVMENFRGRSSRGYHPTRHIEDESREEYDQIDDEENDGYVAKTVELSLSFRFLDLDCNMTP